MKSIYDGAFNSYEDAAESTKERNLKRRKNDDDLNRLLDTSGINARSSGINLMREQYDIDPLFYYEVIGVLGVGSMGSVTMVKKHDQSVGGSARRSIQNEIRRKKIERQCLSIPILGLVLKYICIFCPVSGNEERRKPSVITESIPLRESDCPNNLPGVPTKTTKFALDEDNSERKNGHDNRTTHKHIYAMKSIHLNRIMDEAFIMELRNEIEILKGLDHPHIVRPIETFEYLKSQKIFMIMELCNGGDLYSRDPYTEQEAVRIVGSVLSAISYMHSKNIAHRDLKYENIMFVDDSPQAVVKLIDFGLSSKYSNDEPKLTEGVGTIYTMAPEVIKGNYTQQADLWSVGVITYMLLSSQMPFYGKKRRHIIELILSAKFTFRGRRWKYISNQAKEFVKDLLISDPNERLTADEAFKSFWLSRRKEVANTLRNPDFNEELNISRNIIKYTKYCKLKKVALMIIAHKATNNDIGILRKLFEKFDYDRTGDLSISDFMKAFSTVGYSKNQIHGIFKALDLDGSGTIEYTEFLAATLEYHGPIPEEHIAEAFDRIDYDDSGFISKENLQHMLGSDYPPNDIDNIIKESAALTKLSKPNTISYPEFLEIWNTGTPATEAATNNISNNRSILSDDNHDSSSESEDGSDDDNTGFEEETLFDERRGMFLEAKKQSLHSVRLMQHHEIPESDKREFIDGDDVKYIKRTSPTKLPDDETNYFRPLNREFSI